MSHRCWLGSRLRMPRGLARAAAYEARLRMSCSADGSRLRMSCSRLTGLSRRTSLLWLRGLFSFVRVAAALFSVALFSAALFQQPCSRLPYSRPPCSRSCGLRLLYSQRPCSRSCALRLPYSRSPCSRLPYSQQRCLFSVPCFRRPCSRLPCSRWPCSQQPYSRRQEPCKVLPPALASTTPLPLNSPGLEVAAIAGRPWFTDARSAWLVLAACTC